MRKLYSSQKNMTHKQQALVTLRKNVFYVLRIYNKHVSIN